MPEVIALINSVIDEGQHFDCDDSGWVTYRKVNFEGSDYQSLLFLEFDWNDVELIYSHNQYIFLENHTKYWIYFSHYYTNKSGSSQNLKSSRDKNILTSAAITIDLRPGIDAEAIIEAVKLMRDY